MEKETNYFLRIEDSKFLYGIAILMMLFHHLFCNPQTLNSDFISVSGIYGGGIEVRIAWVCKLCVALYAFISGYGLCRSHRGRTLQLQTNLKTGYKIVGRQLINFYTKYWLVFGIFVPLRFLMFDRNLDPAEFLKNLLGLSYSYNGEWWYIQQYIGMLLIYPILDTLVGFVIRWNIWGKIFISVGVAIAGIICLTDWGEMIPGFTYMAIFSVGYLIARFELFEKVSKGLKGYWIQALLGTAGTFSVLYIRYRITPYASWGRGDLFIVTLFIFFAALMNHTILSSISKYIQYIGRYSVYMWLTHTFYAYYYFQKFILLPRYTILIFLWLLAISLVTGIILDNVYHFLFNKITGRGQD